MARASFSLFVGPAGVEELVDVLGRPICEAMGVVASIVTIRRRVVAAEADNGLGPLPARIPFLGPALVIVCCWPVNRS